MPFHTTHHNFRSYAALWAHGLGCMAMIIGLAWSLLCTDPYASLQSVSLQPTVSVDDFVQHLLAFFVLSAGCISFGHRIDVHRFHLVAALLVFAAATEVLQSIVPGRSTDVMDLVANMLGIAVGTAAFWILRQAIRSSSVVEIAGRQRHHVSVTEA